MLDIKAKKQLDFANEKIRIFQDLSFSAGKFYLTLVWMLLRTIFKDFFFLLLRSIASHQTIWEIADRFFMTWKLELGRILIFSELFKNAEVTKKGKQIDLKANISKTNHIYSKSCDIFDISQQNIYRSCLSWLFGSCIVSVHKNQLKFSVVNSFVYGWLRSLITTCLWIFKVVQSFF